MTMPNAAIRVGAAAAAAMAVQRTVLVKPCVCHHERSAHLNRGKCLVGDCGCRQFAPEPEPDADLGT